MKHRKLERGVEKAGDATERPKDTLVDEIEGLLRDVMLEEASHAVWKRFEAALLALDKESLDLLEGHLNGVPPADQAGKRNLTESQVKDVIGQIKRDLIRHLKRDCNVKH